VIAGLGRRYARAVLALARDEGRLEESGDDLTNVAAAFADEGLQHVLENPAVGTATRDQLAARIANAMGTSKTVTNAIRLLARRDRLGLVGDVAHSYRALLDRELGRTRVVIRSAVELSDTDREQLGDLARRLAQQDVVVASEVDPDLIGGAVLDIGGVVYDGSIKTQLTRMARAMTIGSR